MISDFPDTRSFQDQKTDFKSSEWAHDMKRKHSQKISVGSIKMLKNNQINNSLQSLNLLQEQYSILEQDEDCSSNRKIFNKQIKIPLKEINMKQVKNIQQTKINQIFDKYRVQSKKSTSQENQENYRSDKYFISLDQKMQSRQKYFSNNIQQTLSNTQKSLLDAQFDDFENHIIFKNYDSYLYRQKNTNYLNNYFEKNKNIKIIKEKQQLQGFIGLKQF